MKKEAARRKAAKLKAQLEQYQQQLSSYNEGEAAQGLINLATQDQPTPSIPDPHLPTVEDLLAEDEDPVLEDAEPE